MEPESRPLESREDSVVERREVSEQPNQPSSPMEEIIQECTLDPPTITELPESVTVLENAVTGGIAYVVGTAHVSKQSAIDVQEVIRFVRPECIVLELCNKRTQLLSEPVVSSEDPKPITFAEALGNSKKSGVFVVLFNPRLTFLT
eukprot:TRINITY_DN3353_c0_g2_i2.p1 TRINITY_DN3353_c0_g2~~TRINITY_DN3353_c0_g2_i2.p1  ORF type:complete len:146 (+),score=11.01 TRINITY_DN3353_c0_g2_i2:9-446(+)